MAKKVLIVEDHPATAEMIANILQLDGIGSVIAPDGPAGLEKAWRGETGPCPSGRHDAGDERF